MMIPYKKIIDEEGNAIEAIISWDQFIEFVETYGLDLDEESANELEEARQDRINGRMDQYGTVE